MRAWVNYLLGLTLVAIAAFGAYHVYAKTSADNQCADATHGYRHVLRA